LREGVESVMMKMASTVVDDAGRECTEREAGEDAYLLAGEYFPRFCSLKQPANFLDEW